MTRQEAFKIRESVEMGSAALPDMEASLEPTLARGMRYNGELIRAGTRINWNGTLKRAAVDLWDTEQNTPDAAPTLWVDIEYINGVRKIPTTESGIFDVTKAFAENEEGYSTVDDLIYISKVPGNVYTPQLVPSNWTLKE